MILSPSIVDVPCKSDDSEKGHRSFANVLDSSCADIELIAEVLQSTQQLGSIQQGMDKHFYSNGSLTSCSSCCMCSTRQDLLMSSSLLTQ